MKRAFLADALRDELSALRLLVTHLNMQIVGEAVDWSTALAQAPATHPDMVLVKWELIAPGSGASHAEMRLACPATI